MKASHLLVLALPAAFLLSLVSACKDENKAKPDPTTPPPAMTTVAAAAGACAGGGGALTDALSAPYFPRTSGGYCVDPQGEVKTYGEKSKLSMDDVCTQAFDGECEVYKRFGLRRVAALRYVDGSGKGGSVDVFLSHFTDPGAYAMFTFRVAAGDPAEPATPKPFAAGAAGAIGTGRAYVWRGQYVAELQYANENESPDALAKSSETVLTALGKEIGQRLPGALALPPAAQVLPTDKLVPNGISFQMKDLLAWNGVGPGALGFYKDGDRRWRVLSIVKDDAEAAKDAFKTMKTKPQSSPVAGLGDEAVQVALPSTGDDKSVKVSMVVARKGRQIWGVGDEEYALRAASGAPEREKARLPKVDAEAKLKTLVALPAPAGSPSAAPSASMAPKASASAPARP